jgi:prepilin peptidase CpaA
MIAVYHDVTERRIPNYLTASGVAAGLLLHLSIDGWKGFLNGGAAALIAGLIFFIFFVAGGMGGGDVKLAAAVACLTGLQHLAYLLILTSLAGGAMAVWMAIGRGSLKSTAANVFHLFNHHVRKGLTPHPVLNVDNYATLRLPYGVAIAAGSFLTLYLARVQG